MDNKENQIQSVNCNEATSENDQNSKNFLNECEKSSGSQKKLFQTFVPGLNGEGDELSQKNDQKTFPMIVQNFNPNAEPFCPRRPRGNFITVGPTNISVNADVWSTIATNHDHTHRLLPAAPINVVFDSLHNGAQGSAVSYTDISQLLPSSPAFEVDNSRQFLFRRNFGPVATNEGVELRLRYDVRVLITTEQSALIENGNIRIAVNMKKNSCALDHPNGKIYKKDESIDVIAYDGFRRNDFIRIGKIIKEGIVFTSVGCALVYQLDTAGIRTTSAVPIQRDWTQDFCRQVFLDDIVVPDEATRNHVATNYYFKVEDDGSETFKICGLRISQAKDGMLRVQNNSIGVRTSVQNGSVTLKLNNFHSTASLGNTPHLFIRQNERRIHFDGLNFVVRNQGHSASFDNDNFLRIN